MITPILPRFTPLAKLCCLTVATLGASSCGKTEQSKTDGLLNTLASQGEIHAQGRFEDVTGQDVGNVVFTKAPGGNLLIRVDVKGLSKGWHGIHLHQVADCSDGANGYKASASHVDPDNNAHGLLNENGSERADISNIYAGSDGRATAEIFRTGVTLHPSEEGFTLDGAYPLFDDDGFAVIIHANRDDHKTQPIGGAGARVACAAINAAPK